MDNRLLVKALFFGIFFTLLFFSQVMCIPSLFDHHAHSRSNYLRDRYDNPFPTRHEPMPSDNPDDIKFLLYANIRKPNKYDVLTFNKSDELPRKKFHHRAPLKVLIPGFKQTGTDNMALMLKDVYMKHSQQNEDAKYNIVIVDWSPLSTSRVDLVLATESYKATVKNVRTVGKRIANMIHFLLSQKLLYTTHHVHIVGHSMGAHVAGFTGYELQKIANFTVGRITGLDPVAPNFDYNVKGRSLRASDAAFVDVIHTNPDVLGTPRNLGHVDFYPNAINGPFQAVCAKEYPLVAQLPRRSLCSHVLAYKFFAKSITAKPNEMVATKCDWTETVCLFMRKVGYTGDTAIFGEHCDAKRTKPGVYFLDISVPQNDFTVSIR